MNELSNKVLSELANLRNFLKNKDKHGSPAAIHPLDQKLIYCFQNQTKEKNSKTKKKLRTSSDYSKHSTDNSGTLKIEYSLRDLQNISEKELSGKFFTFQKNLT